MPNLLDDEDVIVAPAKPTKAAINAASSADKAALTAKAAVQFELAQPNRSLQPAAAVVGTYTVAYDGSVPRVFNANGEEDHSFKPNSDPYNGNAVYQASAAFVRGPYVLFVDASRGKYTAVKVAGPDGVILEPRNWKQYMMSASAPEDLKAFGSDLVKQEREKDIVLVNSYHIRANDAKISITGVDGKEVWHDNIEGVGGNCVIDPSNRCVIHYCTERDAKRMYTVDTSAPLPWHATSTIFPHTYETLTDLRMHPSGAFYICKINQEYAILRSDTLEAVQCPELKGAQDLSLSEDGDVCCMKDGILQRLRINFDELADLVAQDRSANALKGISANTILQKLKPPSSPAAKQTAVAKELRRFDAQKKQFSDELGPVIAAAQSTADLDTVRTALAELRKELKVRRLEDDEIEYVTRDIEAAIGKKNQQLADRQVTQLLDGIRASFKGVPATLDLLTDAQAKLETAKALEASASPDLLQKVASVRTGVESKLGELFVKNSKEVIASIDNVVAVEKRKLQTMTKQSEFDVWMDKEYPKQSRWLSELAGKPRCTPEILDRVTTARAELRDLAETYEEKFRTQLTTIREKAAKHTEQTVDYLATQCTDLIERVQAKKFLHRADAEQYLRDNVARQELEAEIALLAQQDADASKRLKDTLDVKIVNLLYAIERGAQAVEGADGRTMVMFGSKKFPRFEGRVRERGTRQSELVFNVEEDSKGPGVAADDLMGDVAVNVTTGDGHKLSMRLWETHPHLYVQPAQNEGDYRYGSHTYLGQGVAPSYRSQKEYRALKVLYRQWRNNGALHKQHDQLRQAIHEHYALREHGDGKGLRVVRTKADEQWQAEHKKLLEEFAAFCAENQVPLLRRMESIETAQDPEFENGKGFVPEWQNHWVIAPEDEKILEEMAGNFKMQLDNQEGMLNLKGHAGTGKDVLLKIFANRANRPYFSFDCSKWTTEFELSEDIVLESKDGASQTVAVPSVVLNAIRTPGAIMYFNEFNAMPEQAQIFLHALFDEKRSLALKTKSGQTVKADPSVLFACSMNPGYPGTFDPQMATRTRMVELDIPYPPPHRPKDKNDTNDTLQSDPYSASEALKIARGVSSLRSSTLDPDMQRNGFVRMWDFHVNKIGPKQVLSEEQKFDLDVVLALVQFGNKLREDFVAQFEKTQAARKALPVLQPITLREMRRCSYVLSEMTPAEKLNRNPEEVARALLRQFFLSHIDSSEDRAKIEQAMQQWTTQKRTS